MAEHEDPRRDEEAAHDTSAPEGDRESRTPAKGEEQPPDSAENSAAPATDAEKDAETDAKADAEVEDERHAGIGADEPGIACRHKAGKADEAGDVEDAAASEGDEDRAGGREDADATPVDEDAEESSTSRAGGHEEADAEPGASTQGATGEPGAPGGDGPDEVVAAEHADAPGSSSPSDAHGPAPRRPMPPEGGFPPAREQRETAQAESAAPEAPGAPEEPADDTPEPPADGAGPTGRQRLAAGLWPPRLTRSQLIAGVLLFVLGLGLAIQVRSTSDNSALRGARQDDLVRILDELDNRSQRLTDEQRSLENQRTQLENSSDQAEEARKQTVEKEQQLGVLAGTVAAEGPGITLTVKDPHHAVQADKLLDTVEELRAAGAEAIQVGDVRIVAHSYFADARGGVEVDGKKLAPPYRFRVIGNPKDLEPALNIPGGVVQTLEKGQATVDVVSEKALTVDALRQAKRPDYARSSSQ